MDIERVAPDLQTPALIDGAPAPGRRVRQYNQAYAGSEVHHGLYLPTDWQAGKQYPVIAEYAGNKWKTSLGTVAGSNLGYGISAGAGAIWLCLPFVDRRAGKNATTWWGDVEATVAYAKETVRQTCRQYGGAADKVFLAGFSRGAIACNYIGLHDDGIAPLWRGFVCHSHYDGVRAWPYAGSDRQGAAARLKRLGDRPQFISHETGIDETADYLQQALPGGNFTLLALPWDAHTDTWVLRDVPARKALRHWYDTALRPRG